MSGLLEHMNGTGGSEPLTVESLTAAMDALWNAKPRACGSSEDSPHIIQPTAHPSLLWVMKPSTPTFAWCLNCGARVRIPE